MTTMMMKMMAMWDDEVDIEGGGREEGEVVCLAVLVIVN
jgi:hypothetical protein